MRTRSPNHKTADPTVVKALRKLVLDPEGRAAFLMKDSRPPLRASRRRPVDPKTLDRIAAAAARGGMSFLAQRALAKSEDDRGKHPYDLDPMPGQRAAENAAARGDYDASRKLWERAVAQANPDKDVVAATAARQPRRLDDSKQDHRTILSGSDVEPQNNPFLQAVAQVTAQVQGSAAPQGAQAKAPTVTKRTTTAKTLQRPGLLLSPAVARAASAAGAGNAPVQKSGGSAVAHGLAQLKSRGTR